MVALEVARSLPAAEIAQVAASGVSPPLARAGKRGIAMAALRITIRLYRLFARRAMPEFARLRRDEQEAVIRSAAGAPGRRKELLILTALTVWAVGWMCFIKYFEAPWLGLLSGLLTYAAVFALSFLGLIYIMFRIQLPTFRRAAAEHLSNHGEPTCPKCAYDLRGIRATRCPECGTPFEPPQ